jgi:hypothetical protein
VAVVAATPLSAAAVRDTIRYRYAAAANTDYPLEYVCLIGDPNFGGGSDGVPTDGSNYDHTFACATSTDDIEDIAVGRLSGASLGCRIPSGIIRASSTRASP